eukprot:4389712-Heterocapsa_arctica.AAC.1
MSPGHGGLGTFRAKLIWQTSREPKTREGTTKVGVANQKSRPKKLRTPGKPTVSAWIGTPA